MPLNHLISSRYFFIRVMHYIFNHQFLYGRNKGLHESKIRLMILSREHENICLNLFITNTVSPRIFMPQSFIDTSRQKQMIEFVPLVFVSQIQNKIMTIIGIKVFLITSI